MLQAFKYRLKPNKAQRELFARCFGCARLAWACERNGCLLVKADKWFASSKTCHDCGYVNKGLALSEREWACPQCGCVHDRDVNAALNLRDWYINQYIPVVPTGIYACGDCASTLGGDPLRKCGR